ATFESAIVDWNQAATDEGREWFTLYQQLLKLRHQIIVPRLAKMTSTDGDCAFLGERALRVCWLLGDGSKLILLANLGESPVHLPAPVLDQALFATSKDLDQALAQGVLPRWNLACFFLA